MKKQAPGRRRASAPKRGQRIGIEVGGTFTDFVLVRPEGSIRLHKSPTTPADQSEGVMRGLGELAASEGRPLERFLRDTEVIVHGTTTADNTLITLSGATVGLLTSAGHRDELELRRGFKENIWDPAFPPPPPICPRRRRLGIRERLDHDGSVVEPLDEAELRRACRRLKLLGVDSVAICFLFSFVNSAPELRARAIVAEELPDADISVSHQVYPSAPEFERTSTTVVNAYVAPIIKRYLRRLASALSAAGFRGDLRIMQSNGGMMAPEYVERRAVAVLGSGPTGGVTAACHLASRVGVRDFIGVDMGGTSYDVSVVREGSAEVRAGWNWHHRHLVALPMVEVYSVGAGGGSIARVEAGVLQVGPESAGAAPGPICYGRGGTRPTVTDANLLLGFLNPVTFCSGQLRLQPDGVADAMREQVGRHLGCDAIEAAFGVFRLINANMSNAIRRVSAQRGIDPRDMSLVVFGGNGALHAGVQAEDLGIGEILVPRAAPALSALGLAVADQLVDEVRAHVGSSSRADPGAIAASLDDLERQARTALGHGRKLRVERLLHLCYPGQTFDMPVPIPAARGFNGATLAATIQKFHELHERLHTYAARDEVPIIRAVRIKAVAVTPKPVSRPEARVRRAAADALRERRPVYFDGRFRRTPVYDGHRLQHGHTIEGPAIIEEPFTTIVVHPGQTARLDAHGTYRITTRAAH